jgi:signal transduction histidine kinase
MLGFIVLLSLTFGIGGSLLIAASFNDMLSRAEDAALHSHRLLLYTLAAVSSGSAKDEDLVGALEQIDRQSSQSWAALRLSDKETTLFVTGETASFDRDMLREGDGEDLVMQVRLGSAGAHLLVIAGRFETPNGPRYLESVYDISSVYAARASQEDIYRKVFAVVVVLGAGISWLMSYWLTRPLKRLSDVTQSIATGALPCRADASGRDEIGKLAQDFNDMTELLEEKITKLTDAMHRQESFMGGFAHELKTPMTSIIGYADLLRSHELSATERREAANYVFSEGRRLELLSLKLLDLIVLKKGDIALAVTDLRHVVAEVTRLIRPVVSKLNISVKYKCEEGVCMIEPDLVKSLLINLVDNARKALENGGQIYIESVMLPDGCRIRVADNGKGIPESELSKITDAFYRVDKSRSRAQGGVGLGLALCREIVRAHNGDMSFESAVGRERSSP